MFRPFRLFLALGLLSSTVAGVARAQEREWTLDASDEDAYLIFGVADTEDVGVSLWCPAHKGVVNLFVPRPTEELQKLKQKKISLTVTAGRETATFAGKVDVNTDAASSSVEVEVPAGHALFKALQGADRFEVRLAGEDLVFPLYDADVAGLLDVCRKG